MARRPRPPFRSLLVAYEGRWPTSRQHAASFLHGAVLAAGASLARRVVYAGEAELLRGNLRDLARLYPHLAGVLVHRNPELCQVLAKALQHRKVPIVLYGSAAYAEQGGTPHWVKTDEDEVVRIGLEHLHRAGHRRIGLLTGPGAAHQRRLEGWRTWMKARGLVATPEDELELPAYGFEKHLRRLPKLGRWLRRCTAVLAASDAYLPALMHEARRRGLSLPRDLSLVGINNTDFCAHLIPALTAVELPQQEDGRRCAEHLLRLIDGGHGPIRETGLVRLVPRESVLKPRRAR